MNDIRSFNQYVTSSVPDSVVCKEVNQRFDFWCVLVVMLSFCFIFKKNLLSSYLEMSISHKQRNHTMTRLNRGNFFLIKIIY